MKEKISCSLDGEMIDFMDDVIRQFPMISSRSAVLEMALITFVAAVIDESGKRCDADTIHALYEGRCKLNAQSEKTN